MIYLKKFEKNQIFPIFFSKLMLTICLRSQISQICTRKFQNWVYLCFGKVLKLKVTKGELIISNHLEMPDRCLPRGAPRAPPPAGIRTPFLNGQRYWAVLWWLLISKPFQSTGELRFEIYYYNFQKFLVKDNWSASILKKKSKNYFFFNFSCKNHTFSVWNWILHEKCFLLMYNMLM